MSSYINPEIFKIATRTPDQTSKQIMSSIRLIKKELKDIILLVKDGKYSEIENQVHTAISYLEAIKGLSKSPTAKAIEKGEIENPVVTESIEESEGEITPIPSEIKPNARSKK